MYNRLFLFWIGVDWSDMTPEKKTNWWVVGGVAGELPFGIAALGGSDGSTQTANVITAPVPTEIHSQVNLKPSADIGTSVEAPAPVKNTAPSSNNLSNDNYYTNSSGNTVHSPAKSLDSGIPAGASAECRDGTYSFSQHRRGTCSHHGGVASWL